MLDQSEIKQKLIDFHARFGGGDVPQLYFAPGRVNLIGEHTDYNGGLVLPLATERGTYFLLRKSENQTVRLYSANLDREAGFDPAEIKKNNDWADYVRGVFLYAGENRGGIPAFDGLFFGDLPLESGLSSSASIELATAIGLSTLGCHLSREEAVDVSRRAENDFVGVSCGIMDQFAVAFARRGHAILLDCDSLDHRLIPCNTDDSALVLGHTGVRRSLAESEYNTRRSECERALKILSEKLGEKRNLSAITASEFRRVHQSLPESLARRAEHIVYENIRVQEAAKCLQAGDPETLGQLMNGSHESLRDLYQVSSPELDALQEISVGQPGVWGCRMTGAGFGGCVVALVRENALDEYLKRVPGLYRRATSRDAEFIVTIPGEGAHMIKEL